MNSWFDFGMGKGGNIITLASYLYATDDNLPYLLDKMEKQAPHVRPTDFSFTQQATEPSFERLEVRELTDFSRVACHPRTSPISDSKANQGMLAMFSRA